MRRLIAVTITGCGNDSFFGKHDMGIADFRRYKLQGPRPRQTTPRVSTGGTPGRPVDGIVQPFGENLEPQIIG
jgi:hypothetical protein